MESEKLVIISSRMPKSKYFFYRPSGTTMDTCKIMYVGCRSTFSDFTETLKMMPGVDSTVACLLFEAGTQIDELVNELEMFIKNCTNHDIKVVLDIMDLYKHLGFAECKNIVDVICDYLICNWNIRFALAPPLLTPNEMEQWEEIAKIQEMVNQVNVDAGMNPLFPFRWVMRPNNEKKLHHVASNWMENCNELSLKGCRAYFRCIWMYIQNTMDSELHQYDLTSRILPPAAPGSNKQVQGRGARGHRQGGGRGTHRRGAGIQRPRNRNVPFGNNDARFVIAHRRVSREFEMLARLSSMNIAGSNTANGLRDMVKNISRYFS